MALRRLWEMKIITLHMVLVVALVLTQSSLNIGPLLVRFQLQVIITLSMRLWGIVLAFSLTFR
jgi:hypothetical protein